MVSALGFNYGAKRLDRSLVFFSGDEFPLDINRGRHLEATGNLNEFNLLALDEGFSDAVSAPDNLLSVGLGGVPFDFALFQVTGGGAEGFDDLTFSPVPLPAAVWLFGTALGVVMIAAGKRNLPA